MRTPARDKRDSGLSSGEVCGTNRPAGRLEAPLAGLLAASNTVTVQPRRARLLATAAPAKPAPTTRQLLDLTLNLCFLVTQLGL
jgi:hypothetical protein